MHSTPSPTAACSGCLVAGLGACCSHTAVGAVEPQPLLPRPCRGSRRSRDGAACARLQRGRHKVQHVPVRAHGAGAQDQRCSLPLEVRCLPLENMNLFAVVLCELCVPNRIGGVLLLSHLTSVGFPTSLIFFINLVAALSRDSSMGSRRNQAFVFRNCKKSSTQAKYNYFRLHAGF